MSYVCPICMSNSQTKIDYHRDTVLPFSLPSQGMRLQEGGQVGTKKQKTKWRFAIGTTSRVPGTEAQHYLMLDIDDDRFSGLSWLAATGCKIAVEPTEHGFHVYTNIRTTFDRACQLAIESGADPAWVHIARKRGYFYLADKSPMMLSWPVQRMVLRAKEAA